MADCSFWKFPCDEEMKFNIALLPFALVNAATGEARLLFDAVW
jgi:hypothetical protein